MLIVIMLSVVMLNVTNEAFVAQCQQIAGVVMLKVIMLSVLAQIPLCQHDTENEQIIAIKFIKSLT
jgi:hypothetical protein